MALATSAATIRLVIIGSHALTRAALRCLLEASAPDIRVIAEAESLSAALTTAREKPDVVLLDLDPGAGQADSYREVRGPDAAPLLVTAADHSPRLMELALDLGARSIVLASDTPETLIAAIHRTHAGETWLRPLPPGAPRTTQPEGARPDDAAAQIASLTRRERQVIELIAEGLRNSAVAERLFVSEATVRNHLTSILDKLELRTRSELVVFAFRHGMVKC